MPPNTQPMVMPSVFNTVVTYGDDVNIRNGGKRSTEGITTARGVHQDTPAPPTPAHGRHGIRRRSVTFHHRDEVDVVKFGHRAGAKTVPGWDDDNVDYLRLKNLIKEHHITIPGWDDKKASTNVAEQTRENDAERQAEAEGSGAAEADERSKSRITIKLPIFALRRMAMMAGRLLRSAE
ncbi:hypothetical protein DL770_004566 [Monosporascus sp. CRB-9-2]|nr:hypothetical protein DL770_004566 [Monosporascus sp. CRB-9-2]